MTSADPVRVGTGRMPPLPKHGDKMVRTRYFILLGATAVVAACASAPRNYSFDNSFLASASYDDTWEMVVDAVSTTGWPPSAVEKESGLIATDWQDLDLLEREELIDCGGSGIGVHRNPQLQLSVTVRAESEGASRVTVNVAARTEFTLGSEATTLTRTCVSTGAVEEQLRGAVLRSLDRRGARRILMTRPRWSS